MAEVCSICSGLIEPKRTPDGVVYWELGESAEPVNDGRCCATCASEVVLPWRMILMRRQRAANGA